MSRRTKWQGLKCSQTKQLPHSSEATGKQNAFFWLILDHLGNTCTQPGLQTHTAALRPQKCTFCPLRVCACVLNNQRSSFSSDLGPGWKSPSFCRCITVFDQTAWCGWMQCCQWIYQALVLYKETQYSEQLAEKVYSLIFFFERGCKSKKKWNRVQHKSRER